MPEHATTHSQDPSQFAGAAVGNVIPDNPNEYLRPDFLKAAIANPGQLYDQLVEAGSDQRNAEMEVEGARTYIADSIMVPEFVVQVSAEAVTKVDVEKQMLAEVTGVQLRPIEKFADSTSLQQLGAQREDAQRAFAIVQAYNRGEPVDPQRLTGAVGQLQAFSGQYRHTVTSVDNQVSEASRSTLRLDAELEQAQGSMRRAGLSIDQNLNGLYGQAIIHEQDLADKAIERGATSIAEHQDACGAEFEQNKDRVFQAASATGAAAEQVASIRGPIRKIGDTIEADMPHANHLEMAIDFVNTSLISIQRHGPAMQHQLEEAVHGLDRFMQKIDRGVRTSIGEQKLIKEAVTATRTALNQLNEPV